MGVKGIVFASHAERRNYEKLRNRWGKWYNLYHNLPFLNIFTREPLFDLDAPLPSPLSVSDADWQRFKCPVLLRLVAVFVNFLPSANAYK